MQANNSTTKFITTPDIHQAIHELHNLEVATNMLTTLQGKELSNRMRKELESNGITKGNGYIIAIDPYNLLKD